MGSKIQSNEGGSVGANVNNGEQNLKVKVFDDFPL